MSRSFFKRTVGYSLILSGLSIGALTTEAQGWKLYAITGQQGNDTRVGDETSPFKWPDHTLFEVNPANAAMTKKFTLNFINDSTCIGFSPDNSLLYHLGGSSSYSNNPLRTGHDQGGPDILGVGYQDSHYMETVNPITGAASAIFNAAPCPNPDSTLPCFGLSAPRPNWVLPAEQRSSTQTGGEFNTSGPDEYHAARGIAWSEAEKLFLVADEQGIFKLTPQGQSTFWTRPQFQNDGQVDESKAIAFVKEKMLLVGHRNSGLIMRINPETGEAIGELALTVPEGGGAPTEDFNGLLGLAQHPVTGVLYGVRKTEVGGDENNFHRELVTINPYSGATTLVGDMGMHVAAITFAQASANDPWKLYAITGQQGNDTRMGDETSAFRWPDHTLFEVNLSNGSMTKLFTMTFVNDSNAIGFNPSNFKLYHTAGSESYSNNPLRTGHDQGQPNILGVGYQDSQYMETVNPVTGAAVAVFNSAPCPNPDPTLPCFGLPAPRPTWLSPEEQRNSSQTAGSFNTRGPDEYHAVRGMAWSTDKNLFYIADEQGIFTLTADGVSKFLARPQFPTDGQADENKAIAFVDVANLYVGHRNAGLMLKLNPGTGEVIGEVALTVPEGGDLPADDFNGLLGLAQHPETGVLYGVRKTEVGPTETDPEGNEKNFHRELVTINPATGVTTLVGDLGMHVTSIAFAQPAGDINVTVTGETAGTITLSWTGGAPKFLVQKKVDLGQAAWMDVLSTTDRTATVAKDGTAGFFRIVGSYTGPDVIPLSAFLSGDGENPAIVTPGTGVATISVTDTKLNYLITYQNMTGNGSAAHIHSPASSTGGANPTIFFANPVGKSGYIMGTLDINATRREEVLTGKGYVNIHTSTAGSGEIRGQVLRSVYAATLAPPNDVLDAAGSGTAKVWVYGSEMKYALTWTGMRGGASKAGLGKRADVSVGGGPLPFNLSHTFSNPAIAGNPGSASGYFTPNRAAINQIVDGAASVAIFTSAGGAAADLVGQLVPSN